MPYLPRRRSAHAQTRVNAKLPEKVNMVEHKVVAGGKVLQVVAS
jgi:hypothetical protein